MGHEHSTSCLDFADGGFPAGTHLCQIYSDANERDRSLRKFLSAGLRSRERTFCFHSDIDTDALTLFLENEGVDVRRAVERGDLILMSAAQIYFRKGLFEPERMLALLGTFCADARRNGYAAVRVVGEMDPVVKRLPGGERLAEYESRVNLLLRECPVSAVCQYDARAFDGETIMDVLKVHPLTMVNGDVVSNPFYMRPEEYLNIRDASDS